MTPSDIEIQLNRVKEKQRVNKIARRKVIETMSAAGTGYSHGSLNNKHDALAIESDSLAAEFQRLSSELKAAQKNARYSSGTFEVSDHAIVRYIERVLGLDIQRIKAEILSGIPTAACSLGDGKYPAQYEDRKVTAVVQNAKVITLVDPEEGEAV